MTVAAAPNSITSTPTKPRILWIDIAKAIAILAVILGHTVGDGPLRDLIFSFHMPAFFVLAGYTFRLKPLGETARSSAIRLLVPYVLIWVLVFVIREGFAASSVSISDELLRLIWASGATTPSGLPAIGMPWFLVCLFLCRVLFDAVQPLVDQRSVWTQGLLWFAVAGAGAALGQFVYMPLGIDTAFVAVFFLWCGYAARQANVVERVGNGKHAVTTFAVVLALWLVCAKISDLEFANRTFTLFPLCLIGALTGTAVILQLALWIQNCAGLAWLRRPLAFIGLNCMLLYCCHALDWIVGWGSLPLLAALPFSAGFGFLLRFAYDFALLLLIRNIR